MNNNDKNDLPALDSKDWESKTIEGTKVFCSFRKLVPVSELKPHPRNANRHPTSQIEALATIIFGDPEKKIEGNGWRLPIVVSDRSGYVIKGHGRLQAAILRGKTTVPVDFQHYESEETELKDLIADNEIARQAERDDGQIASIIRELQQTSAGLDAMEFGLTPQEFDRLCEETDTSNIIGDFNQDEGESTSNEIAGASGKKLKFVAEMRITEELASDETFKQELNDFCVKHDITFKIRGL